MGFMMSVCIIAVDVDLDHLVKVVSAGSFSMESYTIFPFVVSKYLGGDTLILSFGQMEFSTHGINCVYLEASLNFI